MLSILTKQPWHIFLLRTKPGSLLVKRQTEISSDYIFPRFSLSMRLWTRRVAWIALDWWIRPGKDRQITPPFQSSSLTMNELGHWKVNQKRKRPIFRRDRYSRPDKGNCPWTFRIDCFYQRILWNLPLQLGLLTWFSSYFRKRKKKIPMRWVLSPFGLNWDGRSFNW